MKRHDWNGIKIPLVAHAFSLSKGIGLDIHINAATEDEARHLVERKLECRQDFLRQTEGHYDLKFARELHR